MAIQRQRPAARLVHHSDRGAQAVLADIEDIRPAETQGLFERKVGFELQPLADYVLEKIKDLHR